MKQTNMIIIALAAVVAYLLYRANSAKAMPVMAAPLVRTTPSNAKGALLAQSRLPAKMLPVVKPPPPKKKKKSFWGKIGGAAKSVGKVGVTMGTNYAKGSLAQATGGASSFVVK
jgi:hypothetical protein